MSPPSIWNEGRDSFWFILQPVTRGSSFCEDLTLGWRPCFLHSMLVLNFKTWFTHNRIRWQLRRGYDIVFVKTLRSTPVKTKKQLWEDPLKQPDKHLHTPVLNPSRFFACKGNRVSSNSLFVPFLAHQTSVFLHRKSVMKDDMTMNTPSGSLKSCVFRTMGFVPSPSLDSLDMIRPSPDGPLPFPSVRFKNRTGGSSDLCFFFFFPPERPQPLTGVFLCSHMCMWFVCLGRCYTNSWSCCVYSPV